MTTRGTAAGRGAGTAVAFVGASDVGAAGVSASGADAGRTAPDSSSRLLELTRTATRAEGERLREVYALYCAAAGELGQPVGLARGVEATEVGAENAAVADGADTEAAHAVIDAVELATAEVVAALDVFHGRAYSMVTLAIDLAERLPRVLDVMCAGRVTERLARVAVNRTRSVSAAALPAVEDEVLRLLTGRVRHGLTALGRRIDEAVERHDAPGVIQREAQTEQRRFVDFTPAGPGMMALHAQLRCAEAEVLFTRLEEEASRLDPSARRGRECALADALVGLAAGSAASGEAPPHRSSAPPPSDDRCRTSTPGTDANDPTTPLDPTAPVVLRPRITVVVPTAAGVEPRLHFSHSGRAALDQLTELLQRCRGASLETVPEDPPVLAGGPTTHLGYRPGEALRRRIRLRDGTCRFPGCSVPAERCDIDHVRPFDHADPARGGPTLEGNLMCLCRRHHRWKTYGRWSYHLRRDARLEIRLPDGRGLVTEPSGPLAEARRATRRHRQEIDRQRHRRRNAATETGPATVAPTTANATTANATTADATTADADGEVERLFVQAIIAARGTRAPVTTMPPPF